jgi:hypothetical protein
MMACAVFVEVYMSDWNAFMREFWKAAAQGPRLYFAPVVGAIRQTRIEWRRAYRELARDSGASSGS